VDLRRRPAERHPAVAAAPDGLPPAEANRRTAPDLFADLRAGAALPGVLAACERWRPDVVMPEASEFAGVLAGAYLDLPMAVPSITQYAINTALPIPPETR
jgi:hypothetical protein